MENIYITSDTHYLHKNIVRGVTNWRNENGEIPLDVVRDFDNIYDMNKIMIENINNVVKHNDILYFLGDITLSRKTQDINEFFEQINCKNIYLILGNHDYLINNNRNKYSDIFKLITNEYLLKIEDIKLYLSHIFNKNLHQLDNKSYHLHGHNHYKGEKRFTGNRSMDIGIDGNERFEPYSLIDVLNLIDEKYKINL